LLRITLSKTLPTEELRIAIIHNCFIVWDVGILKQSRMAEEPLEES